VTTFAVSSPQIGFMKKILFLFAGTWCAAVFAQEPLTPEMLWSLNRVGAELLGPDGNTMIYGVTAYDLGTGKGERNLFSIGLNGGEPTQITSAEGGESAVCTLPDGKMGYLYKGQIWRADWNGSGSEQITDYEGGIANFRFSPDGRWILFSKDVPLEKVTAAEKYTDLPASNVRIYDDLNYRHWDTWEDGAYSHIFIAEWNNGSISGEHDLMQGLPYDCPQMPFGGIEDFVWHPNSQQVIYVTKSLKGTEYTLSTNTDLYLYDVSSGATTNFTHKMEGFDTHPEFSPDGNRLAWLSMERNGYEADKNRLFIYDKSLNNSIDVLSFYDETIDAFRWSSDGKFIYLISPVNGTRQVFEVDIENVFTQVDNKGRKKNPLRQVSTGDFDITAMNGQNGNTLIVTRTDFNHAADLWKLDIATGKMEPLTQANAMYYRKISQSTFERKMVKTTDGKDMLVWFIYPPDFDPNKKYPTLLYCQGGPQSALTQFYSFRWNFQLMAANGYIVVAPNRRGMPGHGTEWNEQISTDWGGQAIQDYLSAIDYARTLPYVDTARCGAVGASYGGYSVYMLAGIHEGRFSSFIAHDGLFNLPAFYGTTDEMWFANWDMGGPYWESGVQDASYTKHNPMEYVDKWNTPILIYQGGRDYRTTEDQAFQAFQAARLQGIQARFVYLPEENHWVLRCHNALAWQREFYTWLKETL